MTEGRNLTNGKCCYWCKYSEWIGDSDVFCNKYKSWTTDTDVCNDFEEVD